MRFARVSCESAFFFNDTATTEIYTLSLHDALPISPGRGLRVQAPRELVRPEAVGSGPARRECRRHPGLLGADCDSADAGLVDRKSTRLNSSHANISYAVFCL